MHDFSAARISGFKLSLVTIPFLLATAAFPQSGVTPSTSAELRASQALEAARNNPLQLREFLVRMPKGADLHVHLGGAVYAESFIRAGAEDNLCVDSATLSFSKPVAMTMSEPPKPVCGEGRVPVASAFADQHLYDKLINSFSMRSFVPFAGTSGHDHFFDSFAKVGGLDRRHTGEWVDEVAARAAAQNEQYLELMHTPKTPHATELAEKIGWEQNFDKFRSDLLQAGIKDELTSISAEMDQIDAVRKQKGHCGEPQEQSGCKVQARFIYQILRGLSKEMVFSQTLIAFETVSTDPRFVGINYVMPEDGHTSMTDYDLHMRMVAFFHKLYPKVHISLHAGELAFGLVTPDGLCCHVREAVEVAGAERIGHGVDVMFEENPYEILKEMAKKHVMVEINLSSNDLILGIAGKDHPLPIYRKYGVPVALSTDDEGVSRIDITHEYVRAAQTYGLKYSELKNMARTGLEHDFLPGESLWRVQDRFMATVASCQKDRLGAGKPSASCQDFLNASQKAQQQWELERRFAEFESTFEPPRQPVKKPIEKTN